MTPDSTRVLIAEAKRLIAHCKTYNFGMWSADRLAHEVAPELVGALEARQVDEARIRTLIDRAILHASEEVGLSNDERWEIRDEATRAVVEFLGERHESEPTRDEYREAYETWREAGRAAHQALLTIWRSVTPDSEHSTFGTDPQVVVDAILTNPVAPQPSESDALIERLWLEASYVKPISKAAYEALTDAADALSRAAAPAETAIDRESVREAIGEVLADQEAYFERGDGNGLVPVASDLVALGEITDAAILAAVSPPSRTAKHTGKSAVGQHSQKITLRGLPVPGGEAS